VGFEPTPTLLDQNALWQRINGASLETWDWRLRPLGLLLFQEKNPNGLMQEDQMNEISVNFEPLVLGKFVKVPSKRLFL
jgi:hypothetical protein